MGEPAKAVRLGGAAEIAKLDHASAALQAARASHRRRSFSRALPLGRVPTRVRPLLRGLPRHGRQTRSNRRLQVHLKPHRSVRIRRGSLKRTALHYPHEVVRPPRAPRERLQSARGNAHETHLPFLQRGHGYSLTSRVLHGRILLVLSNGQRGGPRNDLYFRSSHQSHVLFLKAGFRLRATERDGQTRVRAGCRYIPDSYTSSLPSEESGRRCEAVRGDDSNGMRLGC